MTTSDPTKRRHTKQLLGLTGTAAALAGGALVSTNVAHADTVDQPNQPVVQQTATDPAQTAKDNLQAAQTKADQATQAQNEAQTAYDHAQGQLNQAHQAVANDQQTVQTAQNQVNQASHAVQSAQAGGPTVTADQVNQASQAVAQAQQTAKQAQQQADQAATAVTRAQQAVDQAQAGNKNTTAQASQAAQAYLQAQLKMGQAEDTFNSTQTGNGSTNQEKGRYSWTPSGEIQHKLELQELTKMRDQSIQQHGHLTLPTNQSDTIKQAEKNYQANLSQHLQTQARINISHQNSDPAYVAAYEQANKLVSDYASKNDADALADGKWDAAALANNFYPGLSKLDAWKYYSNQFADDLVADHNLKVPTQYKSLTDYYDHNLTPWAKSLTWHSTVKDQQELLPEIAVKHADGSVTYDFSKLTDQHLIELNQFGMDILNQIRLRLPNSNGVGEFVGFNTAMLEAAKHAAQVYTQDNWHYLDKGGHDTHALANKDNIWAYGENVDARRDNFPIKNMDDLKHALWLNLREGLFNDGTSNWGHTSNFLGTAFGAFAFDNVTPQGWWQNWVRSGQMHFLTSNGDYGVATDSTNLYHLNGNDDYERINMSANGSTFETEFDSNSPVERAYQQDTTKLRQLLQQAGVSDAEQTSIFNALEQNALNKLVNNFTQIVKNDNTSREKLIALDPTGYQKLQTQLNALKAVRDKYASTQGAPKYIWDQWLTTPIATHPVSTDTSLATAQQNLTTAQAAKTKADQALTDAQKQLADNQAKLKDLQQRAKTLPEVQADYAKAQKALADTQKQLEADQQALQVAQTNQAKAKQALAAAQQAYQTAQKDLATARQAYAKTQAHSNLSDQVAHQAEQLNQPNDHHATGDTTNATVPTQPTSANKGASATATRVNTDKNGAQSTVASQPAVGAVVTKHSASTSVPAGSTTVTNKLRHDSLPQTGNDANADQRLGLLGLATLGLFGLAAKRRKRHAN